MSCFNATSGAREYQTTTAHRDSVTEAVKHKHTRSQPRFTRHAVARRQREGTKEESYGVGRYTRYGRRQRDHEQRRRRKEGAILSDVRSAAARTLQRRHQCPRGALTSQPLRRRKGPALVKGRHEVWGRATREPTASKPGQPFQATPRAARRPQLRREWRKTGGCGSRVQEHSLMVDWAVERAPAMPSRRRPSL